MLKKLNCQILSSLSEHALLALNEFLSEQEQHQKEFEQLRQKSLSSIQNYLETNSENKKQNNEDEDNKEISMEFFKEDWQVLMFMDITCIYKRDVLN